LPQTEERPQVAEEDTLACSPTVLLTSPQVEKTDTPESKTPSLQPDELNFPKLPSGNHTPDRSLSQQNSPITLEKTHFVWRTKPVFAELATPQTTPSEDKGKGKQQVKNLDSAPVTRQGYRSGRLADDFWTALNPPHPPVAQRKTLQVIPILIADKPELPTQCLVDLKTHKPQPFAQVHIAELLAGIPWSEHRVRQHVVNEVAQTLYKKLVFTNPSANPLQTWSHGKWFSSWEEHQEGEYCCTLYACIKMQEHKIKPRKGQNFGWSTLPEEIRNQLQMHTSEAIESTNADKNQWHTLITKQEFTSIHPAPKAAITRSNRFAVLGEAATSTQ
jgi:hypothetical protein